MNVREYLTENTTTVDGIIFMLEKDCMPFLKELKNAFKAEVLFLYRGYAAGYIRYIKKIKPRKNRVPKDTPTEIHHMLDNLFKRKYGWNARSEGVFTTGSVNDAQSYGEPHLFFPIGKYKFLWSTQTEDLFGALEGSDPYYEYNDYILGSGGFNDDFWQYEQEYGEGKEGYWKYKGKNIGHFDTDVEAIMHLENTIDGEISELELDWIPDMTEDVWFEEWKERIEDNFETLLNDLTATYTNKDLRRGVLSSHEMMFKCKEYYLVNEKYIDRIKEWFKMRRF